MCKKKDERAEYGSPNMSAYKHVTLNLYSSLNGITVY